MMHVTNTPDVQAFTPTLCFWSVRKLRHNYAIFCVNLPNYARHTLVIFHENSLKLRDIYAVFCAAYCSLWCQLSLLCIRYAGVRQCSSDHG